MAASLAILTFHALDDRRSPISVRPGVFKRGIAKLADAGYSTLALTEAAACVRDGKPLPEKSFVITFDDGYESVYEDALPVLKKHGMTATVFLTAAESGGRLCDMEDRIRLTWDQIDEMSEAGIDFGAHTMTHPDLTSLSADEIDAEVRGSKKIIEDAIGKPVETFAYPYGYHDLKTREVVRRHFACACSTKMGLVHGTSDLFVLERVDGYYLRTDSLLAMVSSEMFPWYVRMRNIPRRIKQTFQRRPW